MIRRINMTRRIRLPRDCARINIVRQKGVNVFNARLEIGNSDLPRDSEVHIEAYFKNSYMRFPIGKLETIDPTKVVRGELTEIQSDFVYFRVKVVNITGRQGLLLAQADKITAKTEGEDKSKGSLLGVHFEDLGDRIWELLLDEVETLPFLEVNNSYNENYSIQEFVRSTNFKALIFPEVLEKIVRHIIQDPPDEGDEDDWKTKWIGFVTSIPGIGEIPADPPERWYSDLREQFGRKHKLKQLFENEVLKVREAYD